MWAVTSLVRTQWALVHFDVLTPVALGLGAALLAVGSWMLAAQRSPEALRPFAAAQRASLVVAGAAIVLALFWITNVLATTRGEDQAKTTNAQLWSRENSIVLDMDATQRLPLFDGQIKIMWVPTADPTAKPSVLRYQCFRSLAVHGDRWVLVPARWTPAKGFAVIITADSAHRISLIYIKGIADTEAGKSRDRAVECPEVAIDATTR